MLQERITLYYRADSSDKVYSAAIEECKDGFVVNFAFGRRGTTLQTGTKTPAPVPFDLAKKIYDKLVNSKKAKGYTPGADGTPYEGTEDAERDTGLRPQLLNPITEDEVERYLTDEDFWLQEKLDGRRILILKEGGEVSGINRRGLTIALPQPIVKTVKNLMGDFLLDGEAIGDRVVVFDCLRRGETLLDAHPYRDRWRVLQELVGGKAGAITGLATASSTNDKRDLLRFLRQRRAEGAVLKRRDSAYRPGRPASGGTQLKLKFTVTASCIVAPGRSGKRSVGLELLDGLKLIPVGNVTIPGRQAIPKVGQVVEVRYLYAYRGGSLYQPVYLGVRSDILTADCKLTQLKFRRDASEDDEA